MLGKTIGDLVKCGLFSKASSTRKSGVNLPHRRKIEQLTFQAIASCQIRANQSLCGITGCV